MRNKKHRCGFTLVELLVVIAVIGILVSLLLPAVQMIRESARRTACSSHIRQLALSTMNYESAHRRLPTGWIVDDLQNPAAGTGWGWAYFLLPYVEQQAIYDQIDIRLNVDDHDFEEVLVNLVPVFQCPSDPAENLLDLNEEIEGHDHHLYSGFHDPDHDHEEHWIARSNYSGVFGSTELDDAPTAGNGLFFGASHIHFNDVHDGLSGTLMFGERRNDFGHISWAGVFPDIEEPFARVVGAADHTPNHPEGHFEDFRSYHPQGANFAFADGSVHLLNDAISEVVYQALATRDGGEVIRLD